MNNAGKRAEASKSRIELVDGQDAMRLVIKDNGQGFGAIRAKSRRSFGLINLQERTERVGGKATIHSQQNFGTQIAVIDMPVRPAPRMERHYDGIKPYSHHDR